jgi:diguanylate cyclase (GGDEF)-like protein
VAGLSLPLVPSATRLISHGPVRLIAPKLAASTLAQLRGDAIPATRRRSVRPILFLLVYGLLLVIVGATASGQAALVSSDSQTSLLNSVVNADAALVRSYVGLAMLTPADLTTPTVSSDRTASLNRGVQVMVQQGGILAAAILAPDGTVLVSSDSTQVGRHAPMTDGLTASIDGQSVQASIVATDAAGALGPLGTDSVLREYLPIILGGQVRAVVAIWRDGAPILGQLDQARLHIVMITLSAAVICAIVLFFIFRSAQQRLSRQTRELLEATRLDPLTGTLNHGAIVETLALTIDRMRNGVVGIVLLDIDNFTLLNSTYGHPAGDLALTKVSRLLASALPEGTAFGRYGPDEFLVVAAEDKVGDLQPALERLRGALDELALRFQGSERLPVTLSGGIGFYPVNGESVTTLLSVVASSLDEAKASGGDSIRVAETRPPAPGYAKTFDVLQGLIIAVDTKDRYTRRHSEDVARYSDFIADLLALDHETSRAIHTTGLLHDVGKIGIPDAILRKPAELTDEERGIFEQHVALGDMIVRDLPNIQLIRAGIRHHHERWDGHGYPGRLAGADIPLIARIIGVADSFSAMTTTRPYRKALSVEEALARLEVAAGRQLDPAITQAFIDGIRTAASPPLPGAQPDGGIWSPDRQAA